MSLKNLFSWHSEPKGIRNIYEFTANTLRHEPFNFEELRGKVVLIVNVASFCGFTPQYAGLQEVYDKYHSRGLEILGFPCNQFGAQEPGTGDDISSFCSKNYGVTFRIMDKVNVNGENAHPLYKFLKSERSGFLGESVKWNFEKFLIRRNGTVYDRYISTTTPATIAKDIEKLLNESVIDAQQSSDAANVDAHSAPVETK